MNIQELAAKHQDNFPGYQLVDFYEAAFPSSVIQLQVLLQEQRQLPLVEEFVLRAIDAGQSDIAEVVNLLGLEEPIVRSALNELQRRGYVFFTAGSPEKVKLLMTTRGRVALGNMMLQQPMLGNLRVCQDALTGNLYSWRPLTGLQAIRDRDLHVIPTFVASPKSENLSLSTLRKLARRAESEFDPLRRRRELIHVIRLEKHWIAYRVMRILQYVHSSDGALQLLVFDGSERAPEHEAVLLEMERQKRRPLRAYTKDETPKSDDNVFAAIDRSKLRMAERSSKIVPQLQRKLEQKQEQQADLIVKQSSSYIEERQEANYLLEEIRSDIAKLNEEIQLMKGQAGTIEVLEMHQHRPKLLEALNSAIKEIILISPWMTPTAVDEEVIKAVGNALTRGVDISIGYGFAKLVDTQDYKLKQEEQVAQKLMLIARGKKGSLGLFRFNDVHSKVLICDESFMIISSFNWLSFKGDSSRGSRQEHGVLTREKTALITEKHRWLAQFAQRKVAATDR